MPQVVVCVNVYDSERVNEYTRRWSRHISQRPGGARARAARSVDLIASSGIFETAPESRIPGDLQDADGCWSGPRR